jgi:hypothetical protein
MKLNFYIYNPKTKLFDFFLNSLIIELNIRNINTFKLNENKQDINNNDIILIIINPHFIYDYIEIYNEIRDISKNFKFKILYITEPINFILEKKVYLELINLIKPYCLWTYTIENFYKINTYLKIFKIFPNYNEAYNFSEIDLNIIKNKNINNIIFIGNITNDRMNICKQFNNKLLNITDKWSTEEWKEIVSNNLFYLNVHRRNNCKSFESFRIIPLLSNGCVIFSEKCNIEEEKIYEKYNIIFCKKDDLYNTFIKYIENINYNEILEKTILFRNNMSNNTELDNYINFHNKN